MILSANLLLIVPMIFFIQYSMQKEFETSLFYGFNQVQKLSENFIVTEKKRDETLLNTILSNPTLQENLKAKDVAALKGYLNQKSKELGFEQLILLDKEMHLSVQNGKHPIDLQKLLRSGLIKKAYATQCAASILVIEGEKIMRYSALPLLKEGAIVGTVIGGRSLDASLLKSITNGTDIELALIADQKVLISTLEGMKLDKLSFDVDLEWLAQHPEKSLKTHISQASYYVSADTLEQDHLQRPITLLLAVKESAFCTAFNIIIKSIVLTFVIALLIITIFVIVLSHKVQTLFNQFITFTEQIKQGDYETKIDMNTNDEFQILARNLEDMREAICQQDRSLQTYALSLGAKVDDHTKKLKVQSSYLQTILDIQNELIVVINDHGLSYANKACLRFWGVDHLNQLKGKCELYKFFGYEDMKSFISMLKGGEPFSKNIDFEKSPGEHLFFEVKFYPIQEATKSYMVILNDVTSHAEEKKQLYRQATTDALTGLSNRFDLENKLTYILEQIKRSQDDAVFCLIDIDNFKNVNDTYGHLVGDQILIKLAMILQENIRQSDLIARWGGEEFVLVLYPTTLSNARHVLEQLRIKITEAFSSYPCQLTCSFGATALMHDSNLDEVFREADDALYTAKANGKNRVSFCKDLKM